MEGEKSWVSSA